MHSNLGSDLQHMKLLMEATEELKILSLINNFVDYMFIRNNDHPLVTNNIKKSCMLIINGDIGS